MTTDEAQALYDTGWWNVAPPLYIAAFQLREDRLCMPWSKFHEAVESVLGRGVAPSAFALCRAGLIESVEKLDPPSQKTLLAALRRNAVMQEEEKP